MTPIRVASVHYLNAEPLTWGFAHGSLRRSVRLSRHPPSRIPDLLESGAADVGLIPAIEYQRLDGLEILPGMGVGSKRRARSVLLVSTRPMESIRTVALDGNSRTSAALLRIVLAHRGVKGVDFAERPPSLPGMLADHDAALLIGDPALTCNTAGLQVWDLGAEWRDITGLPFVFAVWAKRIGTRLPGGAGPFEASLREGLRSIDVIAAAMADPLGLSAASLAGYLRDDLHYALGDEERQAMDLFFRKAREGGLVGALRPIRFLAAASQDRRPSAVGLGA
jgi:chorismate dehydratase